MSRREAFNIFQSKKYAFDLIFIILLASFLLAVIILIPDNDALRIIFGLPFILFLPGYALVCALWPGKEREDKKGIDDLERIALSFGLSIAVVPLVGLALNYTPWGIRLYPILISLFAFIIIMSITAWYRRRQLPEEDRFTFHIDMQIPKIKEWSSADKILGVFIVISLIIASAALIYITTTPRTGERYTEFYILDQNGTTKNYPKNLIVGENGTVIIGVVCHEHRDVNYTLVIGLFNNTNTNIENTARIYTCPLNSTLIMNLNNSFVYTLTTLKNDESWTYAFNFTIEEVGRYAFVAFLYEEGANQNPYFEWPDTPHIWINVGNR